MVYISSSEGGWLNKSIVDWFVTYSDTCFQYFGDYVKDWITFNEPYVFTVQGYVWGNLLIIYYYICRWVYYIFTIYKCL